MKTRAKPSAGRALARGRKRPSPETAEPSPRIARRERRRQRSREEILEAARRVLLARGIAATTLDAVAAEAGLTKTALYYYFPGKDALLFELVYGVVAAQSRAVHEAAAQAKDGAGALRAIIGETVRVFAANMDDFRLAFMHGQVAGPDAVRVAAQQLERIRPLNDLAYGGAAERLAQDWKRGRGRARVEPRLMAFLASLAAIGVLTMKGMVESVGDPLAYSDDELVEGLARVFEAAARP